MSLNYDFTDACADGDLSKAKALLKRGADIHAAEGGALYWAARNNHPDVAKYLVEQGANIHVCDDFTLRVAAGNGHLDVVKYLVGHGADIHARDDCALKWATYYGHLDVTNFLREAAGPKYKCHKCLIKSTCLELCEDFRPGRK